MKRPQFTLQLARWHQWLIYAATALLVVTGGAWLLLDLFGKVQGEFGAEPNPALPWLLLIHGTAAYAFVIVAAMLVPVHIRLGWNTRRNRISGLSLVGINLFALLTGLVLYYATSESVRPAASLLHWLVGFTIPIAIIIHLLRGRGSRPDRANRL